MGRGKWGMGLGIGLRGFNYMCNVLFFKIKFKGNRV